MEDDIEIKFITDTYLNLFRERYSLYIQDALISEIIKKIFSEDNDEMAIYME